MSGPYRITLIHLTADASAVAPASERLDHGGNQPLEEVIRLTGKLAKIDQSASVGTEPGLVVQRGDKSYRIVAHQGRIRIHKSISLFDDFWTIDSPAELANLPPFHPTAPSSGSRPPIRARGNAKQSSPLKSAAEVIGLFAVAVILVAVGLRFGLPQKRLSDLPDDITLISSPSESASVFATVAGSYATGKAPGNNLVIIQSDGRVLLTSIGKDGKPGLPRVDEQARAGRRGSIACVITSFGIIAGTEPPEAINVGRFQYRRAQLAVQ
ncbi:hypothetical protein ESB00_17995 [Oleiharenicola lentus]|jgi:hypothetical protein|uniref:Uncharacterized protein n=1 Tax=Oleiharenicola lentus TaxID=2508720 RepID=A0A4Q1C575_9BACT|nr:hypothetical protein [Oleiharenicola lentus]RXK53584.1 hypothetical protein ESB00_17995 [Oleiharenicola lentus]